MSRRAEGGPTALQALAAAWRTRNPGTARVPGRREGGPYADAWRAEQAELEAAPADPFEPMREAFAEVARAAAAMATPRGR